MELEISNCRDCPFCNVDVDYGRDACNAPIGYVTHLLDERSNEQLPTDTVHDKCPLKNYQITVKLKQN